MLDMLQLKLNQIRNPGNQVHLEASTEKLPGDQEEGFI